MSVAGFESRPQSFNFGVFQMLVLGTTDNRVYVGSIPTAPTKFKRIIHMKSAEYPLVVYYCVISFVIGVILGFLCEI